MIDKMSPQKHPVGAFVRCDRAWSQDLAEPAWYYVVDPFDGARGSLLLKGYFRPDLPLKVYTRIDCTTTNPVDEHGELIARTQVVPLDEVPADVMALFVKWKLLGEPDADED